jgi:hypothetical protein
MAPRKGNTQQAAPALPERLLRWLFAGIAFVLVCAAALSAPTLYSLARLIDFPKALAWLLPAALDGYAATSIWFGRRIDPTHPAYRSARRNSRYALGLTVGCNGLYHFLILAGPLVPEWVRIVLLVVVSSLPPLIVDRLLHLNSLAGGTGTVPPAAGVEKPAKDRPATTDRQPKTALEDKAASGSGIQLPAADPPVPAIEAPKPGTGIPTEPAAALETAAPAPAADPEAEDGNVFVLNGNGRRSAKDWATLAMPYYREYLAQHGQPPAAPKLAQLLRDAHPELPVPKSERSERNIRSAADDLASGGESESDRALEVAS